MTPAAASDIEYVIDVALSATAVYFSSAASWHTSEAPAVNEVGPVRGLTVTIISTGVPGHEFAVGVTE